MVRTHARLLGFALALALPGPMLAAAKPHLIALGATKKVPYSVAGDPAGAAPDEKELRVRPLVIDTKIKEWTTGDAHDVTDRSFAVRRAIRLNDALPTDKVEHWIWQRGPWLLVDRVTGHITAIKLPDYDPAVSNLVWFRDYAAYCGLNASGRQLFAVVAQVAARKPLLAKKLEDGIRKITRSRPARPLSGSVSRCASPFSPQAPHRRVTTWLVSPRFLSKMVMRATPKTDR